MRVCPPAPFLHQKTCYDGHIRLHRSFLQSCAPPFLYWLASSGRLRNFLIRAFRRLNECQQVILRFILFFEPFYCPLNLNVLLLVFLQLPDRGVYLILISATVCLAKVTLMTMLLLKIFSVVLNVSVSISTIIFLENRLWPIFSLALRLFITLFALILLLAGSLLKFLSHCLNMYF